MRHVAAAISVLFVFALSQGGDPKLRPPRDHPKAIESFRKLVKDGFKGKFDDTEAAFNACFQTNDSASAFGDLLKSATRSEKRRLQDLNVTVYVWEVARGKEKIMSLDVYIGLDPPTVVFTQVKTFW